MNRPPLRPLPWLAALAVLLPALPARAAFLSEGSYATGGRLTDGFGTASPTYRPQGATTSLVAGSDAKSDVATESAIRFALAGVTGPATAATLTVTVLFTQAGSGSGASLTTFGLYGRGAADAGPVTLADFAGGSFLGGETLPTQGVANLTFSFDATASLLAAQAAGAQSFAVAFLTSGPLGSSATFGNPTLAITYAAAVPEPGSAVLAGIGVVIAGAGWMRRK